MIPLTHLHPMMVHFPIALILTGFLFDVLSLIFKKEHCLSKAGFWLMVLGMIAAIVSYGTGYFFTESLEGEAGLARERHETFATLALISIILTTVFRVVAIYMDKNKPSLRYTILGLYLLTAVLIAVTGYLGGKLVFDFMIGL